jgi:hypothetical protein
MFRAHFADFVLADRRTVGRVVQPIGLLYVAVTWADHFLCGLRGHVMVRHFEPRRLRCSASRAGCRPAAGPLIRGRRGTPSRARVRVVAQPDRTALEPHDQDWTGRPPVPRARCSIPTRTGQTHPVPARPSTRACSLRAGVSSSATATLPLPPGPPPRCGNDCDPRGLLPRSRPRHRPRTPPRRQG